MKRVVIVGGGLAGLTAAFRLRAAAEVAVWEADARLGGQLWTERRDGFTVERGAEGFVAKSEALPALAAELGIDDQLCGQALTRSYGFDGSGLRELAPGEAARFLGFQVARRDFGKGIRTFERGMGSVVDALRRKLPKQVELRVGEAVRGLQMKGRKVELTTARGEAVAADAAIVATTAHSAAQLLDALAPQQAAGLAHAPTLSSVTVELSFARGEVDHPLDGTGFVVASEHQRFGMRACTFSSSKFPGRVPDDHVSLRVFFRPEPSELESLDDATFVKRAQQGLRRVLGITAAPRKRWVSRWGSALPVFSDAHKDAVAALERALSPYPIALAGAAFHGSGIDAAVRSAETAAARIATG